MTVREIVNAHEGNAIEAIIFERIKKFLFMMYPFADYRMALISVHKEKSTRSGIYIRFINEKAAACCVVKLNKEDVLEMIVNEYYTPFHNPEVKKGFEDFIAFIEKNKNEKARKPENEFKIIHVQFTRRNGKSSLLKFLEGLLQ